MLLQSDLAQRRRFAAELLACTVLNQFPNVLLAGGGVNQLGFYYDFVFQQKLSSDFLAFIEMHLKTLVKEDVSIRFGSMMRENAESFFLHHHQPLLAKITCNQKLNVVDLLQLNKFSGLCPHLAVEKTGQAGYLKLLDMQNREVVFDQESYTVTRIVGSAFPQVADLKHFSKQYDFYLKKKDHRLLGKEMKLFYQDSQVSSIEWMWLPGGLWLRNFLQNWADSQAQAFNYLPVATPGMIKKNNKKNSPFALDLKKEGQQETYKLDSSKIQQHLALLKTFSFDSTPLRLIEYGTIYEPQPEAELFGLLCENTTWTDQRTIVCSKELLSKELISSLLFIEQIIKIFGFEAHWCIITSIQKSSKSKAEKEAIESLEQAIQGAPLFYSFTSERIEEENIIGPRLELRIKDELQREWSCSSLTIVLHERKALDFLKNQDQNGDSSKYLTVISKSLWGSLDRFVALLIEHYEGELPLWLAPEQVRVLSISKKGQHFIEQIVEKCQQLGIRVKSDLRDVKLSQKIHDVRRERVPYTIIIGDQEVRKMQLTVQYRKWPEKSHVLELDKFVEWILKEKEKSFSQQK